jgi:hypothetical protein
MGNMEPEHATEEEDRSITAVYHWSLVCLSDFSPFYMSFAPHRFAYYGY